MTGVSPNLAASVVSDSTDLIRLSSAPPSAAVVISLLAGYLAARLGRHVPADQLLRMLRCDRIIILKMNCKIKLDDLPALLYPCARTAMVAADL